MHTCPVLAFTNDTEEVFDWFRLTYRLDSGFGWVRWERAALPRAGGMEDQPALLMAALDWVASERNKLLARETRRKKHREK